MKLSAQCLVSSKIRISKGSYSELEKGNITKLEDKELHLTNCKGYMNQVKEYVQVYSFFITKIEAEPSIMEILYMYSYEMCSLEYILKERILELEDEIKMQKAIDRLRGLKKNRYRKHRKKKKKNKKRT